MSEPEDVLSREVTIGAELDETGLSLKAKSRAVAGFDRLIGSLADFPAAFIETATAKKRPRASIDERLLLAQADIAEKKLRGMGTAGDEFLFDVLEREARRQANDGAVAIEALNELKALPAPDQSSASPADEEPDALDDDWLNQFSRFAEDASSEDLQQLWGRVLAGEIHRPRSFSKQTLRFISELDQETAKDCAFAVERLVGSTILNSDDWKMGCGFTVGIELRRMGLLEGVGAGVMRTSNTIPAEGYIQFSKGQYGLHVVGPVGAKNPLEIITVTRLGREVFSLLKAQDDISALRELGKHFCRKPFESVELGTCKALSQNLNHFTPTEALWRIEKPHS